MNRRYEYAIEYLSEGGTWEPGAHGPVDTRRDANQLLRAWKTDGFQARIIRREVGKWEVVE